MSSCLVFVSSVLETVLILVRNPSLTELANSEFVALLKQANTDSSKMAEVIGVSDAQLRFVTNSQSGMGLLKCGNVVIPFDNQIGKDVASWRTARSFGRKQRKNAGLGMRKSEW